MPSSRFISYSIFIILLSMAAAFHLGPAILAGIFSFTILDSAHRKLSASMRPLPARWLSLLIFTVTAVLMAWVFWRFIRQSMITVPDILARVIPPLNEISLRYGIDLPFENIYEFRHMLIEAVKENASNITHASSILTRGFFHVLIGIFIAVLCFMNDDRNDYRQNLYDAFRTEFNAHAARFMQSFERVLGAQVVISAINTVLTAIFLVALGFPYVPFLVPATFILGILPVIGNLLSNTIILCTALSLSPHHAVLSFTFLVVIHKGEYILNSKIIGSSIRAPMWQTLLGILVGEVILGVPGIVLAPAILHYVREEMLATAWLVERKTANGA